MINNVVLVGRITRDIEMTMTNSGTEVCRFSLAVNRNHKEQNGERLADFINCVAFGQSARFMSQYLTKGSQVGVVGRIQTGSYDKQDGTKVYTTDIIVESINSLESRQDNQQNNYTQNAPTNNQQVMQDHFGGQMHVSSNPVGTNMQYQPAPQQVNGQAIPQGLQNPITDDDLPF